MSIERTNPVEPEQGAPGQPLVSIVIVSFNTRTWLQGCIDSIPRASATVATEIIVVDNASIDGSADYIASSYPQFRLLRNSSNLGFAKAVNQGASVASGDYILLLNPDGYLKAGAIDALIAFARDNPQYSIVGGRTVTPDGDLDPRSCWAAPSIWSLFCGATLLSTLLPGSRLFDPESMGWFQRDQARTVDIVTGCLLLISTESWQRLGGFDEKYFVYGEDADLCLRARAQLGRSCAITPSAVMVHAVGASSATRPAKLVLLLNGRIALVRSCFPGWKGRFGASLIVAGVWVRAMIEKIGVRRGAWLEVWRGRDGWRQGYVSSDTNEQTG